MRGPSGRCHICSTFFAEAWVRLQQVNEPTKEREVERTYERDMEEDFRL